MLKNTLQNLMLVAVSAALALVVTLTVMVAVAATSDRTGTVLNYFSVSTVAEDLRPDGAGGYTLGQDGQNQLLWFDSWAMLLDGDGDVIWSEKLPADVPLHYTLAQVGSFTRWYLNDYPVTVWQYGDGLLVAGGPKGSAWKYGLMFAADELKKLAVLLPLTFLAVLALTLLLGQHSIRRAQARRDAARSLWIDGISHDIRTPLSVMMGYAGEWAADETLPAARRRQAGELVAACTGVKTLVADLNLTMRLDYAMQPLRREPLAPAALLRSVAADALNSGLVGEVELTLPPEAEALRLTADAVLLRRALTNLMVNAVRHGGDGPVRLGCRAVRRYCVFTVENTCAGPAAALLPDLNTPPKTGTIARDGTAAHGTGLRLVRQVARVHHGRLRFAASGQNTLLAELWVGGLRRARAGQNPTPTQP